MEINEDERLVGCQRLCQERSGCDYFSFHSTTSFCYLKSAKSSEVPEQTYVSGNKYCGIFQIIYVDFNSV